MPSPPAVRSQLLTAIVLAVVTFSPSFAKTAPQDDGSSKKDITYNHQSGKDASYHRALKSGENLTITVTNTAPACFDYALERVPLAGPEAGTVKLEAVKIPITHDAQYGGYIVNVRRLADAPAGCKKGEPEKLKDVTLIVSVETQGIEVAFGGGFSVSGLTNPVYGVRPDGTGQDIIIRDEAAEDDFDLGVAAFIHVYGEGWHPAAPSITFGLGITEASQTTFYLGPFWRVGKQAFFGGGAVFGSVDRLPAGTQTGDVVTDPNVLNNLGTRTDVGGFIGFSYTFLGGKKAFEKPFESVNGTAGSVSTSTGTAASAVPAAGAAPAAGAVPAADALKEVESSTNKRLEDEPQGVIKSVALKLNDEKTSVLVTITADGTPTDTDKAKLVEMINKFLGSQGLTQRVDENKIVP